MDEGLAHKLFAEMFACLGGHKQETGATIWINIYICGSKDVRSN